MTTRINIGGPRGMSLLARGTEEPMKEANNAVTILCGDPGKPAYEAEAEITFFGLSLEQAEALLAVTVRV